MDSKSPFKKKKDQLNTYLKYSGMAFQMGATIGIGTWAGVELDDWMQFETPVFTLILSLFSVIAALYLVLKDFIKK